MSKSLSERLRTAVNAAPTPKHLQEMFGQPGLGRGGRWFFVAKCI